MTLKNALFGILVFVAAGIISACLDEAESHSGISAAEFDAYVAATEARITALEANQPGDKVFAGDGSGTAGFAKAATADGKPLGTAVGFLPVDVPVYRSTQFSIKSPNGYLYSVPNDNNNTNGVVGISGLEQVGSLAGDLYFAAADCSGQGHVSLQHLTDYGASQGIVFRLGAGEFNATIDNPAQYFYVAAGTGRVADFTYNSHTNNIDKCTVEPGVFSWAYPALLNDPAVTGVDSAPVPIPISMTSDTAS